MNTVECPKCALRLELDEATLADYRDAIFCPQCGNEFTLDAGPADDSTAYQTA